MLGNILCLGELKTVDIEILRLTLSTFPELSHLSNLAKIIIVHSLNEPAYPLLCILSHDLGSYLAWSSLFRLAAVILFTKGNQN